ncbi:type II toxin-antitoxin system HicB family antitoxin [Oxalobacteraceae bacterium A2-2]
MLNYPVILTPDSNGTYLVDFPDLPTVHSVGNDEADALLEAADALETALSVYFDERRPIPLPSEKNTGDTVVALSALSTAKVLIWNEMFAQKMRKADLARLLKVHTPQIDRLFDLKHSSKIEFVEQAAKALGKRLSISLI